MITLYGAALLAYQVFAALTGRRRLTELATAGPWWGALVCWGFAFALVLHLVLETDARRQEHDLRRALREVRFA